MGMPPESGDCVTVFLCGDVMTGRGIDQILPHPCAPQLYEPYVSSAYEYVELAQRASGPIATPADFAYIWGDALTELERRRPAARIVNLETAVTTCEDACAGKGINYRMNPQNIGCLTSAGIDCCALANNHTMDWGATGLEQTLQVVREAGLHTAGAGANLAEACAPARLQGSDNRGILVFACGMPDSGIPADWSATEHRPGLCVRKDLSSRAIDAIAERVDSHKHGGDVVVMSVHWGGNWGYDVPAEHQRFAHQLIDTAGVDIVHGHSSHHPKPIEVHRGKLILYGCGDLLNDYEGIGGYEHYRANLGLMYFPTLSATTGELVQLTMTPTCVRRMRVNRADRGEARWLHAVLSRECAQLGTSLQLLPDNTLALQWGRAVNPSGA